MLSAKQRRKLETLIVEVVIATRDAYLREQKGRPPLGYWARLESRARIASITTSTISEWASAMQRGLQIETFRKGEGQALLALAHWCDEQDAHSEALDMIEKDHAMIIAIARQAIDERKEAAEEAKRNNG